MPMCLAASGSCATMMHALLHDTTRRKCRLVPHLAEISLVGQRLESVLDERDVGQRQQRLHASNTREAERFGSIHWHHFALHGVVRAPLASEDCASGEQSLTTGPSRDSGAKAV